MLTVDNVEGVLRPNNVMNDACSVRIDSKRYKDVCGRTLWATLLLGWGYGDDSVFLVLRVQSINVSTCFDFFARREACSRPRALAGYERDRQQNLAERKTNNHIYRSTSLQRTRDELRLATSHALSSLAPVHAGFEGKARPVFSINGAKTRLISNI